MAGTFMVANAIVWYFLAANLLEKIIINPSTNYSLNASLWSIHFAALLFSFIAGALLTRRITRGKLFGIWILLGVVSPLSIVFLDVSNSLVTLLVCILFGISLGLGMPSCMESFKDLTTTENRGRYGGLIILFSSLGFFGLSLLNVGTVQLTAFLMIVWRLFALAVVVFNKSIKVEKSIIREVSFTSILKQRSFILYLIPWLMFSLVNYLSVPVQYTVLEENSVKLLMIVENVLIGVFAVVGGHLLDTFGRKRTAIVAFVLLGLGYSVLGLYPEQMTSWLFYTAVDGIAWGMIYVIFVISIWGDLSFESASGKYYAIGILPFFISKYLQLILGGRVAASITPYALFSFIAFFLFVAVLPLVYAPETLSDRVMKAKDLQSYVKKALDRAEKDKGKSGNKKI